MTPIKIAHVITRLILGGAQENTLLSVEGLQAKGDCAVDLITGPAEGPEGSLIERASAHNVALIMVPELCRAINPFKDLRALQKLSGLFRKKKYDIVHTHSSKAGIVGRAAAHRAGTRIIVHTIHGLPFHPYERAYRNMLYTALERRAARYTDRIITVCPEMQSKALSAGIGTPEQYAVVYSGIEVDPFMNVSQSEREKLRVRLRLPPDALVIGKVARLFHLKGHADLLAIAPELIRTDNRIYFLFIGDGILRDSLESQAERLGIADRVRFAGLVPPEEIPVYLHAMDVVVHLSLREGLARVIPQAFLCRRPVVAYNVDGACDIIKPGVNGILVPPGETGMLATQILALCRDTALRQRLGDNGFQDAVKIFPHTVMVESLYDLYKTLVLQKDSACSTGQLS